MAAKKRKDFVQMLLGHGCCKGLKGGNGLRPRVQEVKDSRTKDKKLGPEWEDRNNHVDEAGLVYCMFVCGLLQF